MTISAVVISFSTIILSCLPIRPRWDSLIGAFYALLSLPSYTNTFPQIPLLVEIWDSAGTGLGLIFSSMAKAFFLVYILNSLKFILFELLKSD